LEPKFNTGPWTAEEHQRFLDAIKNHGKDWELIQSQVGTRSVNLVRAHGQKFLEKLIRFLNNKKTKLDMSMEEAEFYFGILN